VAGCDTLVKASIDKNPVSRGQDDRRVSKARRKPHGEKTAERVALSLIHDIVSEDLREGDRLPLEAAMINRYQVSRASLREALRLLEVQGLVDLKPGPGGGPAVGRADANYLGRTMALFFRMSACTYSQLLRAHMQLEIMCAELAAEHPDRAERMKPFLDPSPPDSEAEYRRSTIDFHVVVHELTDNPILVFLVEALSQIYYRHVIATMDPVAIRPTLLEEHRELAQAIIAGDVQEAKRQMTEHFHTQHEFYRTHWPARMNELIEWR